MIAMLLAAPFINVLAMRGGARWLAAYGVVAAMGAVATAVGVALTIALFRLIGAKRTRLIAQIVAAVIGARLRDRAADRGDPLLRQPVALRRRCNRTGCSRTRPTPAAPSGGRRAPCSATGARSSPLSCSALALLGAAIALFSRRFGDHAIAAAGVSQRRRAPAPLVARLPPPLPQPACCGRRNGRCSRAIPG